MNKTNKSCKVKLKNKNKGTKIKKNNRETILKKMEQKSQNYKIREIKNRKNKNYFDQNTN